MTQHTAKIRGTHGRSGAGHEIAAAGLFPEARAFADLAAGLQRRFAAAP